MNQKNQLGGNDELLEQDLRKTLYIRFIPHPFSTFKWFIHIAQLPKGLCWLLFRQSNWIINADISSTKIYCSLLCVWNILQMSYDRVVCTYSNCSRGSSRKLDPYKMNVRLKLLCWAWAKWEYLAVVQWLPDKSADNYITEQILELSLEQLWRTIA